MSLKKILNLLIFLIILGTFGCQICSAETDLEAKKRETREQINRLKWLESLTFGVIVMQFFSRGWRNWQTLWI